MTELIVIPWYAWVAIVGILAGSASGIVKMLIDHRERMAMIAQGMDPNRLDTMAKSRMREL